MNGVRVAFGWLCLVSVGACATSAYQPLPLDFPAGLPEDAFERVSAGLRRLYGQQMAVVDPEGFRLQTEWVPHRWGELPGKKRATVFRDDPVTLAIVVEVSYLVVSTPGLPYWTEPRGDPRLERELADALLELMR